MHEHDGLGWSNEYNAEDCRGNLGAHSRPRVRRTRRVIARAAVQEYDSAARRPRAIEELLELRGSGALLRALVERNVKVRYKRSAFGFLWTMLSPTLMLVVLSLVFTRAFAADA